MPRSARLHPPGLLHLIMIRGIDGAMSGTEVARLLNMSQRCVAHAIRRGGSIVKMKKLKMLGP